ncbi:MAG TPA: ATP-binding protein, partial [Azonexus sp.]|nr:ATP-binding protein [Azonexus sp.]
DEDALQGVESARFGVHHGEIGTWLTEQWQLDSSFADGILFHHALPQQIVTAAALPQIVWLAHAVASHEEITPELVAFHQQMTNSATVADLGSLRQQAEQQTRQIAEALGFHPPEKLFPLHVWENLPATPPPPPESAAESELSAMIGGMALLQPLQQDLFALESDAEVLLSLKESARILFDLNRLAFLLYDPAEGKLSGAAIGDQPAIFRQIDIPLEAQRSLVAAAAIQKKILASFDPAATPQGSLIDIQFARALGSGGLLCIPMIGRKRISGVMICGLSQAQYARLAKRLPWLLNFGRIAAISLDALQEAKDYRQQAEQEASSRFNRQARRVIHEAGNPLGIIKSYLRILDRKLPAEAGVRQELEVLTEEIDRVASIVGRMSDIPQEQAPASGLDAGELVNELLLLYGDALFQARGIRIEAPQPGDSLRVNCERDSLKQILLNLWKNASEALTTGQQFKISLTDHVVHDGKAYIQVRMDDNGPGMSEATMRSIHQPPENSGSSPRGMGLAIVGTLARHQRIPITCRSQAGKGTSIALLLPKFESPSSGISPHPEASPALPESANGVVAI